MFLGIQDPRIPVFCASEWAKITLNPKHVWSNHFMEHLSSLFNMLKINLSNWISSISSPGVPNSQCDPSVIMFYIKDDWVLYCRWYQRWGECRYGKIQRHTDTIWLDLARMDSRKNFHPMWVRGSRWVGYPNRVKMFYQQKHVFFNLNKKQNSVDIEANLA